MQISSHSRLLIWSRKCKIQVKNAHTIRQSQEVALHRDTVVSWPMLELGRPSAGSQGAATRPDARTAENPPVLLVLLNLESAEEAWEDSGTPPSASAVRPRICASRFPCVAACSGILAPLCAHACFL